MALLDWREDFCRRQTLHERAVEGSPVNLAVLHPGIGERHVPLCRVVESLQPLLDRAYPAVGVTREREVLDQRTGLLAQPPLGLDGGQHHRWVPPVLTEVQSVAN